MMLEVRGTRSGANSETSESLAQLNWGILEMWILRILNAFNENEQFENLVPFLVCFQIYSSLFIGVITLITF